MAQLHYRNGLKIAIEAAEYESQLEREQGRGAQGVLLGPAQNRPKAASLWCADALEIVSCGPCYRRPRIGDTFKNTPPSE